MSTGEFNRRYVAAQTVLITVQDRALCQVAITLLSKRLTRAKPLLASINVAAPGVAAREVDCQALTEHFNDEVLSGLGLPMSLIGSLRVGLALEYDMVQTIRERKATKLNMEVEEEELRLRQLDRLISSLDVARMGGETDT